VPNINDSHYAIAVGINTYPSLRPLTSSVKDATRFCQWLGAKNGGNLPDKNIKLIPSPEIFPSNSFAATPIQDDIDEVLRKFGVGKGQRVGERLYFYFAGHGFGPDVTDVGMLMARATMDLLGYNIGLRPYRIYFHELAPFDQVVFILDCCRSRDYNHETRGPLFTPKRPLLQNGPQAHRSVDSFVVMGSPYGGEAFAPVEKAGDERRGILTTAVLEGLYGHPRALDPLGRVTAGSLRTYVIERVKELAKEAGLEQKAEVIDAQSEIIFREKGPAAMKTIRVHIVAPPEIDGEFILRETRIGAVGPEIERRNGAQARAANPWAVDLAENTRYELEHPKSDIAVVIDTGKAQKVPYVFKFPKP